MLIVGEKEQESGTVGLRKRGEGDLGAVPLHSLSKILLKR